MLGDARLDWLTSLSTTTQDEPDLRYFNYYSADDGLGGQAYYFDNSLPAPNRPTRYFRNLAEDNQNVKIDFTQPLRWWGGRTAEIKAGVFQSTSERAFSERTFTYDGTARFDTTGDPNRYLDSLAGRSLASPFGNQKYSGTAESSAGYLMFDLPATERLRLIFGARQESTDIRVNNNGVPSKPLLADDLLPALGAVWQLRPDMNLRLNYGKTLARPTFREIANYESYDPSGDEIFVGNPDLQRTLIDNLDARWEWFPRAGEIVSLGVFHKQLDKPIEKYLRSLDGGKISFVNRTEATPSDAGGAAASPKYDVFEGLPDTVINGQNVHRFGGNDDNDSCGVLRYVSIRHGGKVLESNKELNGLSLCAVGRGTTVEFVEAYAIADDGFEFFGGTVNTRYLVSAFNDDDAFDADQGHRGRHQFWFSIQSPDARDKGFELNGEPNGIATGATPIADLANPENGGTMDLLVNGTEGHHMLDNIGFDADGNLLLQEDPGNQAYVARIHKYVVSTGQFFPVATHRTNLFTSGQPGFLTQDEESSGIIDVSGILGYKASLLVVQVHSTNGIPAGLNNTELVENGQLLLLTEVADGDYTLIVSNAFGSVTSAVATVSITASPAIADTLFRAGLPGATASTGGSLTLAAPTNAIFGTGPLTYQWRINGTNILGANSLTLTLPSFQAADLGAYSLEVRNAAGQSVSMDVPVALVDGAYFGGVIINGPVGARYQIEYLPVLGGGSFTPLTTITLPSSPYIYVDTMSSGAARRFYRAVPQP